MLESFLLHDAISQDRVLATSSCSAALSHSQDAALSWPGKQTPQSAGITELGNRVGKKISKKGINLVFFLFFLPLEDNHWFLLLRNVRDTRTCYLMHIKGWLVLVSLTLEVRCDYAGQTFLELAGLFG